MGRHALYEDSVREHAGYENAAYENAAYENVARDDQPAGGPVTKPIPLPRTGPPSGPGLRRVGLAPGEQLVPPRRPRWRRVVVALLVVAALGGAAAVAVTTIRVPSTPAPAAAPAPAVDPDAYLTQTGTFARYFAGLDQAGIRTWRTSPRTAASNGVEVCNAFAARSTKAAQLRAWRADPNHLGVPAAQAPAYLDVVTTAICPEYPNVTRRRTFSPEGLPG